MKVEIYDQYVRVYSDNQNNNKLTEVPLFFGEVLDLSRYTLVHNSDASTVVMGSNLSNEEANKLVTELYIESLALGVKVDEKIINLNEGYAEMVITFNDGKVLNRVIHVV